MEESTPGEQNNMPQDHASVENAPNGPRKRRWIRYGSIGLVVLLILGIVGFLYWMQPPTHAGQAVVVEVQPGSSTKMIGQQLADKDLIRAPLAFQVAVWWSGKAASLQAGRYAIIPGTSIHDIIDRISGGKVTRETMNVTIPEGYTIEKMADLLSQKGIADRDRFLKEADQGTFDASILKEIPQQEGVRHRLEGYLFPDTYEILKGTSEHDIIAKMLEQSEKVITPEMKEKWKNEGLLVNQAVTLASLVEREAKVSKERPIIAAVIFNRLHSKPPMLLQIDATIQYAIGQKPELTYEDLEINSPYNTYKHEGLPPGPIASPGLESLQAVVNPAHVGYLYYVTKKDGTGEHYFANTLEEHNRNIALSEKNQK